MLGHTYRYQVYNGTGVSVTVTVKDRKWKFGTDGSLTDATEATQFSSVSVSTVSYSNGSTVDNSSDKYLGASLVATFAPGASATGSVTLYLQRSTDGGTTWPSDGLGEFIGAHYFAASATSITKNLTAD